MYSLLSKNHANTKNTLLTSIILLLLALSFIFMIRPLKAAAKYVDETGVTRYEKGDKFTYDRFDVLYEVDLTPYNGYPGKAKVIGRAPHSKSKDISIYGPTVHLDEAYAEQFESKNIPVTEIAPKAFKNDKYLESMRYDGRISLTTIGASAFENCKKLKYFNCNSTDLIKIDKRAFYNCKNLTAVNFSSTKLTAIKKNAFPNKLSNRKQFNFGCPKSKMKAYSKLLKKSGCNVYHVWAYSKK